MRQLSGLDLLIIYGFSRGFSSFGCSDPIDTLVDPINEHAGKGEMQLFAWLAASWREAFVTIAGSTIMVLFTIRQRLKETLWQSVGFTAI